MSNTALPLGLSFSQSVEVGPDLTVPAVSPHFACFHDMPAVFATAFMVGFIEDTCVAALKPHLSAGQKTVGTHVDVSHTAPTPIGRTVTCSVDLMEVEGRRLRFKVACRDDKGSIGEGFHERMVIDVERFLSRLAAAQ